MAISSSLATKAGAAGTLVAGTGLGGTYLAWDHITLYAVEREVLGKDLQFTVTESTGSDASKTITISVPAHEDSKKEFTLSKDYEWSCKITVDGAETSGVNSLKDLASRIRDNLPTSEAKVKYWEKHKKDKARGLFVKACSKIKDPTFTSTTSSVKGTLILKKYGNDFKFVNHPELDDFVKSELKLVEREVIEKDVKLTVTADTSKTKLTVKAENGSGNHTLTSDYSWTCEITLNPAGTDITNKLQNNLPKDTSVTIDQRINKELLVRACLSGAETTSRNDTSVTGKLTLTKGENNSFSFNNHPELKPVLDNVIIS